MPETERTQHGGPHDSALSAAFVAERPRLVGIAARVLGDAHEAEDVVQQTWLRLQQAVGRDLVRPIESLPAWLTTVAVRLCLDRLRARTPVPRGDLDSLTVAGTASSAPADPLEQVVLADSVAAALHVVLDRLTPTERVAFVLHDSLEIPFPVVADMLGTSPAAARKLASRARAKVRPSTAAASSPAGTADAEVVDAFLAAAREGEYARLLELLAPDAVVSADRAALGAGTPERIEGREAVAAFFDGAARTAFPVLVDSRPGAAWYHRGRPRVVFDFTLAGGRVRRIELRADPALLARLVRRSHSAPGARHGPERGDIPPPEEP